MMASLGFKYIILEKKCILISMFLSIKVFLKAGLSMSVVEVVIWQKSTCHDVAAWHMVIVFEVE